MSATLSRLILSLALFPTVPALWMAIFFPLERWRRGPDDPWILITHAIVAAFYMAAWILIWRRQIAWTFSRCWQTAVAGPLAILPAALGAVAIAALFGHELGLVVGGILWLPFWMGATAMIWRDTPLEATRRVSGSRGAGPRCPQCRYNLSGLTHARCPECGTEYTLDELFAAVAPGDGVH